MSDVEDVKYATVDAAISELVQLSRMLEIARSEEAKVEQTHNDLKALIDKLAKDRRAALHAIDAMTEAAPSAVGVEISPSVERTGEGMTAEVDALINEVAAIVQAAGGL